MSNSNFAGSQGTSKNLHVWCTQCRTLAGVHGARHAIDGWIVQQWFHPVFRQHFCYSHILDCYQIHSVLVTQCCHIVTCTEWWHIWARECATYGLPWYRHITHSYVVSHFAVYKFTTHSLVRIQQNDVQTLTKCIKQFYIENFTVCVDLKETHLYIKFFRHVIHSSVTRRKHNTLLFEKKRLRMFHINLVR